MKRKVDHNVGDDDSAVPSGPFSQIQAHIPLSHLAKKLPLFLEHSLNPEIYCNYQAVEKMSDSRIEELASVLREHGRSVTIHGPFFDLSPGAVDPGFRALTVERMCAVLKKVRLFRPASVIFHPGYDPLRFHDYRGVWLKNSLRTWRQLLPHVEKMPGSLILIENIFEREPSTLTELLGDLPTPPFGFCFDTGHFQVFSDYSLEKWMTELGPYLRETHLHDNHGQDDEHLPPGRGIFDFPAFFHHLSRLPHPVIGTIEAHNEADLWESFDYLKSQGVGP